MIGDREETNLEIGPGKMRSLISGCKMYTVRGGHCQFSKNIRVSSGGGEGVTCIVNSYTHTIFSQVPFTVFTADGYRNIWEAIQTLRIFSPGIGYEDEVTIIEFRTAL